MLILKSSLFAGCSNKISGSIKRCFCDHHRKISLCSLLETGTYWCSENQLILKLIGKCASLSEILVKQQAAGSKSPTFYKKLFAILFSSCPTAFRSCKHGEVKLGHYLVQQCPRTHFNWLGIALSFHVDTCSFYFD